MCSRLVYNFQFAAPSHSSSLVFTATAMFASFESGLNRMGAVCAPSVVAHRFSRVSSIFSLSSAVVLTAFCRIIRSSANFICCAHYLISAKYRLYDTSLPQTTQSCSLACTSTPAATSPISASFLFFLGRLVRP